MNLDNTQSIFEEVLDKISDGFVALDKNWCYSYINTKGAALLNNHTPEQLLGKHIWTVFPEGVGQPFYHNYVKVMEERTPITMIDFYEPWQKYFENRIVPSVNGGITILYSDITEQKKAELRIQDAEFNMRTILDNTEEYFLVIDQEYIIVTMNKSAIEKSEQIFGQKIQLGTSVLDITPPEQRLQLQQMYDTILAGERVQFKISIFGPEGNETIFQNTYTPIKNANGEINRFMVTARDITNEEKAYNQLVKTNEERKKAEELAKLALIEKQRILDSSLDVICSVDRDGRFLQVSSACETLWGYKPDELIGKNYMDLVFEEDHGDTIEISQNIISGHLITNFENRYIKKDGTLIPMVWSARWDFNDQIMYSIARDASEKKKSEKALLDSEEKYRSIFNLSPLPKFIFDTATLKILEVNQAAINHYGYSREQFTSKTILEIRPPEDVEAYKRFAMDPSTQDISKLGEWRHLKANGEIIHVELTRNKINYNGKEAIMILSNDITERKESEVTIRKSQEALYKSNERFEYVSKATSDAVWDWDIGNEQLYWADSYKQLFGYELENNQGDISNWYENIHPDERAEVVQTLNAFIEGNEEVWRQDYRYQKADGSYAYIADKGFAIRDKNGNATRMIGSMRDVTQEKAQVFEILRIKQNLDSLINNTTDTIWSIDSEMRFVAFNKPFKEVIQKIINRAIKEGDDVIFPELDSVQNEIWTKDYKRALSGEKFEVETHRKFSETYTRYVLITFTPIVNAEGKVHGVACFGKDITELKIASQKLMELNLELQKRAEELIESNEELERFAYVASHDLQEPLRMVSSFLQLLEKKYEGNLDDLAQKYIHFAVDGAKRMKTLIQDLLQYSRIGTNSLEIGTVDMNEVLKEVLMLFKEDIESSKAEINFGILPVIKAAKTAMSQLLQNLIGNALKYKSTEKSPRIEISFRENVKYWEFAVQDNGIGIDPRFKEKIFIIFQRLHNKDEFSGTGIGLAICKKIVERHKGQISVESEQGSGSKFIFSISKQPNN